MNTAHATVGRAEKPGGKKKENEEEVGETKGSDSRVCWRSGSGGRRRTSRGFDGRLKGGRASLRALLARGSAQDRASPAGEWSDGCKREMSVLRGS